MDAAPTRRIITSRSEFHDALRGAFALAASSGAREIWLSDQDFADWPLGERQVVDQLTQWAHSHRHLTLIAHNFDEVARRMVAGPNGGASGPTSSSAARTRNSRRISIRRSA